MSGTLLEARHEHHFSLVSGCCTECGYPHPALGPGEDSPNYMAGNLAYLREKYAVGFISLEELEIGLDSVLNGGPVNVPKPRGE